MPRGHGFCRLLQHFRAFIEQNNSSKVLTIHKSIYKGKTYCSALTCAYKNTQPSRCVNVQKKMNKKHPTACR